MKEGSFDIPAMNFYIYCDEYNKTCLYNFDQVDGLTMRQVLENYSFANDNRYIALVAVINKATVANEPFIKGYLIACNVSDENLEKEISNYFEDILISEINHDSYGNDLVFNSYGNDSLFSVKQIASTFCERYRGRDREFIEKTIKYELRR